jgi:hypothetical protein
MKIEYRSTEAKPGYGNAAHVEIAEKQKTFFLNSHNRLEKPKAAFPYSHSHCY